MIPQLADGGVRCRGYNAEGQLGDGTTEDRSSPAQIGAATDWQTVAAGDYHTVALKTNGSFWVWGNNSFGQIGDGRFGNQKNSYTRSPAPIGFSGKIVMRSHSDNSNRSQRTRHLFRCIHRIPTLYHLLY